MNAIDVHAGDMIYVDAGTVHAICPGAIMIETQQNSDTTYRLYDYGRPRAVAYRSTVWPQRKNARTPESEA